MTIETTAAPKTRSGYLVKLEAFIPVDNNDPDSVINAATAVKVLKGGNMTADDLTGAFAALTDIQVDAKFVNQRGTRAETKGA